MKTALACALLLAVLIVFGPQLQACPTTQSAESGAGPVPSAQTQSTVGLSDVSGLITGVGGGGMGPITVNQGGGTGATGAGGSTGSSGTTLGFVGGKGFTVGKVVSDGAGGFTLTPTGTNKVVFSNGTFTLSGNAPRFITDNPSPTGSVTVDPGGTIRLISTPGMTLATSTAPTGSATGAVRVDFNGTTGTGSGTTHMVGGLPGAPGAVGGIHVDDPPALPDANQSYLEGVGSTR